MLDELLQRDKRLAISNARLRQAGATYHRIHTLVDNYLLAFAQFHGLVSDDLLQRYDNFGRLYAQHLEAFRESGRYPSGNDTIDRTTYDIAQILSCVTDGPRFDILNQLWDFIANSPDEAVCVIGAGSGLELELLRLHTRRAPVTACDTVFSAFVRTRFGDVELLQESIEHLTAPQRFRTLLAVEVLEHVEHPAAMLASCRNLCLPHARLACTTAANMPQFDHRHNFDKPDELEHLFQSAGFAIAEHRHIEQRHAFSGVRSWNDWFVLEAR